MLQAWEDSALPLSYTREESENLHRADAPDGRIQGY
jgi:hypothetical protein